MEKDMSDTETSRKMLTNAQDGLGIELIQYFK